jgi:thiol-disulfide isomerase/thioredoxin
MTLRLKFLLCAAAICAAALSYGFQANDLVGKPAPLSALGKAVTGKSGAVDLAQFKGKIVVLDFWATWCGPCIQSMPHLNELVAEFKDQPVEFIALSDEPAETISGFLKENPIHARVATDVTQAALKAFGVAGIPTTFIIDRSGVVLHVTHPMSLDAATLKSAIAGDFKATVAEPKTRPDGKPLTIKEILGVRGQFVAGQDPTYCREDLLDLIDLRNYQTILRRGLFDMPCWAGGEAEGEVAYTALSQPAPALFAFIFNKTSPEFLEVEPGAIDPAATWDLIIHRLENSTMDSVREEMRPIMEGFFNVSFEKASLEREVLVVKAGSQAEEKNREAAKVTDINNIVELLAMANQGLVYADTPEVGHMQISSAPFFIGQSYESLTEALKKQGFDVVKEKRTIEGIRVKARAKPKG